MNYQEREIDLIDLMWKVAFAWKQCLVVGIICAMLLPGIMYLKDMRSYSASLQKQQEVESAKGNLSKEEQRALLAENLTNDEMVAVDTAVMYTRELDAAMKYYDNSPLMKIDPYNSDELVLEYYINSGYEMDENGVNKESYTEALSIAYINLVNNGSVANSVADSTGLSSADLSELIYASAEGNNVIVNNVTIRILGADEDTRTAIATGIKAEIEKSKATIANAIGAHEITELSEYTVRRVNTEILDKQASAKSKIATASNNLENYKKAMSEDQLNVLNGLLGIEEDVVLEGETSGAATSEADTASAEVIEPVKPSFSKKYAAIGFVLGIFIVAGIIFLKEVLSGTLHYASEFKDLFGIDLIGVVRKEKEYKGLDKLLYNLRYKNKRQMSEEEAIRHLVKSIGLLCKEKDVNRLFVSGSCMSELGENIRTAISNELAPKGIVATYGDNVSFDKESLEAANDIKNMIVVEKVNVSVVEDIAREIETVKEHGVNVIGGVLLA